MTPEEKSLRLIAFFQQYATDHKRELMEQVLGQRTRHITVVLEDIYQSQNASAVMRTCECLGIQDVHVIENTSRYGTNKKVLKGSHYWLNIIRHKGGLHDATGQCLLHLKSRGYRIAITDPSPEGLPITEVPVDAPLALIMGNEQRGISPAAMQLHDLKVHIPMVGFTESLNISVSTAICLHTLLVRLRASDAVDWHLSETEKNELRLRWLRQVVRRSDLLEREFLRKYGET